MTGTEITLWPDSPPSSGQRLDAEQRSALPPPSTGTVVRNVVVPTLTPHVPEGASDLAVIVCPGGAFHFLSIDSEGHDVAAWLAARGVAAFVLKYRVVPTPVDDAGFHAAVFSAFTGGIADAIDQVMPLAEADGERAVQIVRGLGFARVGLLGFSAGGRLGAELLLRGASPPLVDLAALIYVPTAPRLPAPTDAPPLFLLAAHDDPLGIEGTLQLHGVWRDAARPVELHLFDSGGHGFGAIR